MTLPVSRRLFLGSLASFLAAPSAQANPPAISLRPHVRPPELLRNPAISARMIANSGLSGRVAYAVADPKTGEFLESFQPDTPLPPASVAKAITAMYALEHLGPKHRFQTRIIAAGPIQNGILQGDLILAGGGDPTLDTDDLARIAADLKAAGLREVRGEFLVWGGAIPYAPEIDNSQPDHVGYNPALSGLSLNYNRVYFEWSKASKGWGVTMDARSERYRPEVQIATMSVVQRDLPVYTYASKNGRDAWTVASKALGKKGARWLPVRKPDIYVGQVFRTFARAHGIVLKTEKPVQNLPKGQTLVTYNSAPLDEILRGMLKYSTNLTAELVGMAATRARLGRAVPMRSSAREMSRWAAQRHGMTKTKLVDHSGLGDKSTVSARDMARLLISAHKSTQLADLLKKIPLRDANGRVDKSHPVNVHAKTGTLNFVSSLAGFAKRRNGTELAFVIFTADQPQRNALTPAQRERPKGARTWNRRSKSLQQQLIERWTQTYGT
jgi:D-alanyl-D-alanine carboxypeptidase/D-alanyl-D-alanine-endopeptidase (penicillin-binding protein 4)